MNQAQKQALAALQPFIHLANSSTSHSPRFIANIITNATSAVHTFVFSELLETPAVQSLTSPEISEEYRSYVKLLEIFAWGTWEDYHATSNLPALSEAQTVKLRLLSLLTLSTVHNPLTYSTAMEALSLKTPIELESLVTQAIYSSLISARLSPTTTPPTINFTSIAPLRDVHPRRLDGMISLLNEWQGRCQQAVDGIEAEIKAIRAEAARKQAREKDRAYRFQKSINKWNGDEDEGGGATGTKEPGLWGSLGKDPSSRNSASTVARRLFGGGSSSKGHKREYNATGNSLSSDQEEMEIDPSIHTRSMKAKLEAQTT